MCPIHWFIRCSTAALAIAVASIIMACSRATRRRPRQPLPQSRICKRCLNNSGGTALTFSPGKLNYSITGSATGGSGGFSNLLEKSNGTFEVAVWNEPQIWNDTTRAEITPSTSTISITFGRTCTTANVYDLMTGTSPISTSSNVSLLSSLSLVKDPLVIECIP